MELGIKIKNLRIKHGLTQEQLADLLGISSQSISKWENLVTMPDITLLPQLSEIFGVTIDELFDLSIEQKMNRIESKFDMEEELSYNDFTSIENFLKLHINDKEHKYQATYLLAFLYTHRLMSDSKKINQYAGQAIMLDSNKKDCQWMLGKSRGDHCWDWDINNHNDAINFYKEVVETHKDSALNYYYLIDNLIADHRTEEAEHYLNILIKLRPDRHAMIASYKAGIELARYNEKEADRIMAELERDHIDDEFCLFELAQYYTKKGQFDKAISYYELSFEKTTRRPRYIDELLSIATIDNILGNYKKEVETYDRIIDCYKTEWNMVDEEVAMKDIEKRKLAILQKIK